MRSPWFWTTWQPDFTYIPRDSCVFKQKDFTQISAKRRCERKQLFRVTFNRSIIIIYFIRNIIIKPPIQSSVFVTRGDDLSRVYALQCRLVQSTVIDVIANNQVRSEIIARNWTSPLLPNRKGLHSRFGPLRRNAILPHRARGSAINYEDWCFANQSRSLSREQHFRNGRRAERKRGV